MGQPLTLSHGTLVLDADGSWTFTPNGTANALRTGETAIQTVIYEVSDNQGGTAQATLTITLVGLNDGPVVVDPTNPGEPGNPTPADPNTVVPAQTLSDGETVNGLDLSPYVVDPEGQPMTFAASGLPAGLTMDPSTGIISGTIDPSASQGGADPVNAPGEYPVTVTATDDQGQSVQLTFTMTVGNPGPDAVDDAATTDENAAVSGDVLANDSDTAPDSDALTVSEVNGDAALVGEPVDGSAGGTFTVNADGTWTFDPGTDFESLADGESRATSITYEVSDGEGGYDTATLTVTVSGSNDGPIIAPPAVQRDLTDGETITPIDVSTAISNPNGLSLTYAATGLPDGLAIDPATGVITGTVADNASVSGPYYALVTAYGPGGEMTSVTVALNVSNVDPQAQDDDAATTEDTAVVVNVLANDTDGAPDGDELMVTGTTTPANGSVTINADGTITYTPNSGFVGTDTFDYTVSDGQGGTVTATVTVEVGAGTTQPQLPGVPESTDIADQSANDGDSVNLDVSGHFSDPDGQSLTYAATGLPPGLSIDPNTGQITGTIDPGASKHGPYTVRVTAIDPDGNHVTEEFTFDVANPAPDAVDDMVNTDVDTPIDIVAMANDSDPDGDALHIALINQQPANGTVTINTDGTITYTPNSGFTGTDSFTYVLEDANGGRDEATITVNVGNDDGGVPQVTGPNGGAVGPDGEIMDPVSLEDGATITPIDAGSHFSDPDGQPLTFSATGLPEGLSIDPATGQITGTLAHDASASGPYEVTITAVDPDGKQVSGTLTLNVNNPAPVAADDEGWTNPDTPLQLGVMANDADPDGDAFDISISGPPANGTVVVNGDGSVTYTPNSGFTGTDTFEYTITDEQGATDTAEVTVHVGDDGSGAGGGNGGGLGPNVGLVDRVYDDGETIDPIVLDDLILDPEGGAITYTVSGLPAGLVFDPATGTISGTVDHSASQDGTDPVNAPGDYTITVTATDAAGTTVTQTFTMTVGNPGPDAVDDAATTDENAAVSGDVLANDSDTAPDSDALTVSEVNGDAALVGEPVDGSAGGTFTVNADGTWTFDPGTDFESLADGESRATSITYEVSDGEGGYDTATLTVTVSGSNDGPIIAPPAVQRDLTDGETITPIDVSTAISNPNGLSLTYAATGLPDGLAIDPATGVITGTVADNASVSGPYYALVTAYGPGGEMTSVTVALNVSNVDPQAQDDDAATTEDTAVVVNVLANDTDGAPDGDELMVTGTTTPANGSVTINADGTITYTPNSGFVGTDTFDYTVSDGQGGTVTATVTVEVGAGTTQPQLPGVPESTDIADQSANDGDSVNLDVSGHFSDPDGQSLTYAATGLPPGLSIDPNTGQITGTIDPGASKHGPYTVRVTAIDPDGNHVTEEFTFDVANPAPDAVDDMVNTDVDTPIDIVAMANDSDPDGDALHIALINQQPANGTVTINTDGTITYTPNSGFTGTDSFTYVLEDANGGRDEATITVNVGNDDGGVPQVTGPNGGAVGPDGEIMDPVSLEDGATITPIDAGSHFSDPDGQPLTFSATGLPEGLSIDPATGQITGTLAHDASASGPYEVTITAVDPDGKQVSGTLTLNVNNPAPVAADDEGWTNPDTPLQLGVMANDADPDGDAFDISISGPPANGTVVVNGDGSVTYTPNSGFTGTDTFEYTITDEQGATDTAEVTVHVGDDGSGAGGGNGGGLGPNVGLVDRVYDDGETIDPIVLDDLILDPEGGAITYTVSGLPAGLVFDPATGTISGTVDHSASQDGTDPVNAPGDYTITVTATDAAGTTVTQTFTMTVNNVPVEATSPIADQTGYNSYPLTIETAGHFTDPDGDTVTYSATGLPAGLTIDPDTGVISGTIDPSASLDGPYTVTVTADDGEGGPASITFTIDVLQPGGYVDPSEGDNGGDDGDGDETGSGGDGDEGAGGDGGRDDSVMSEVVNGIADLNASAAVLSADTPIADVVDQIKKLNAAAAALGADTPIADLNHWIDSLREHWAKSVAEGNDASKVFVGEGKSLPLSLSEGAVFVRTLVVDGKLLVIDIGRENGGTLDGWQVTGADGGALPWSMRKVDDHTVLVEIQPDRDWIGLRLLRGSESWDLRINQRTGEIVQMDGGQRGYGATFLDQLHDQMQSERQRKESLLKALAAE